MKNHKPLDRLIEQYEYHNRLFINVIDQIKPEDAKYRINGVTNHTLWLAGNLAATRYDLAQNLGLDCENKFAELFENQKGLQEDIDYPNLDEIKTNWEVINTPLKNKLETLTEEALFEVPNFKAPQVLDNSLLSYILFIIDRESYIIGQIALIRKALGYESIKYN